MNHLRFFYYLIIVLTFFSLWVVCFLLYRNKKNKLALLFLVFLSQSILYYTVFFIEIYIQNTLDFPLSIQQIWELGGYIDYFRWLFLFYVIWNFFKISIQSKMIMFISLLIFLACLVFSELFPFTHDYFSIGLLFFYFIFMVTHKKFLNEFSIVEGKILNVLSLIIGLMFLLRAFEIFIALPFINYNLAFLVIDIEPIFWLAFCGLIGRSYIKKAMIFMEKNKHPSVPLSLIEKYSISPREKEVLDVLVKGHSNKEIAEKLFISQSTVKKHINSIFKKFNIDSRWQLLRLIREEN